LRKRFAVPTVASASVQSHSHPGEARGRAHAGHEPAHPFAELLDGTSDSDGTPPAQANDSGPKDPPAQAANAAEARDSKECKPGKDDKCAAKAGKKTEKSEGKEARATEKTDCAAAKGDCAELDVAESGEADDGAAEVEDVPAVDEAATDQPTDKPNAPTAALAPMPMPLPPTQLSTEAAVAPPAIMPPDLAAAIDDAAPVDAMPPVQSLGMGSPKTPAGAPEIPPAAASEPAERAAGLAQQAPSAPGATEIEKQPQRQPEFAQALKATNTETKRTEDTAESNQDPPAEKRPEQKDLPSNALAAQNTKPEKAAARNGHAPGEPASQSTEPVEARPQDAPSHLIGQVHASSVANTHALEAPAAERGVAQGIPAPAVLVPIAGLAIEFAARLQAGRNRFEIRLDPPELGRVDVLLDVDREGNVTSRLVVERTETLDLLRRDASQLERALQQAGLKTADNSLQFSLRDQSSARQHDDNPNRARVPDPDLTPAETGRIYGRMLGLGGGVDIRV
jgi:flagellar hook-length control protein FliK